LTSHLQKKINTCNAPSNFVYFQLINYNYLAMGHFDWLIIKKILNIWYLHPQIEVPHFYIILYKFYIVKYNHVNIFVLQHTYMNVNESYKNYTKCKS
jgi:hypothetical protein